MTSALLIHEYRGEFGGAERYLELLAQGLQDAGHQVGAIVFAGSSDLENASNRRMASLAAGAVVLRGRSRPGPIHRLARARRPDVLHWNFVDPFAFRGASWLLLPWGSPSVITDHLPQLRHAGVHWETTRRLANRRIAAMIVVGGAARAAAAARWRRPPPVVAVPNGVPVGAGNVRPPLDDRPMGLLFVGRLTEQKGALRLVGILEAVRSARMDARLRVVGDGPLLEPLRRAIDDSVEFAGFADDPVREMASADALLAPSAYEGLPFTLLEGLSSGLPLVLSDIPPHRELADEGDGAGVQAVPADDPAAWADAVERVAANLAAASADALARAEAHSVERMVEGTVAVYQGVLPHR